jgi:hypothetical protein
MKIVNIYHRDAANPGDLASSPLRYFLYACETFDHGAASTELLPTADALVVGGGGLIHNPTFTDVIDNALQSIKGPKVLWGAGFNRHSYPFGFSGDLDGLSGVKAEIRGYLTRKGLRNRSSWATSLLEASKQYPRLDARYDLIGVRDWGTGHPWVPCASCMHPIFDKARQQSPKQHLVVVDHPLFFRINTNKSMKTNNLNVQNEEIVSKLSEAEVVLTSSYHAAYWAILLARKVVVVPWSTKFLRFRWPIEFAFDLDGVKHAIRRADSFPNALDEARSANVSFAREVSALFSVDVVSCL